MVWRILKAKTCLVLLWQCSWRLEKVFTLRAGCRILAHIQSLLHCLQWTRQSHFQFGLSQLQLPNLAQRACWNSFLWKTTIGKSLSGEVERWIQLLVQKSRWRDWHVLTFQAGPPQLSQVSLKKPSKGYYLHKTTSHTLNSLLYCTAPTAFFFPEAQQLGKKIALYYSWPYCSNQKPREFSDHRFSSYHRHGTLFCSTESWVMLDHWLGQDFDTCTQITYGYHLHLQE